MQSIKNIVIKNFRWILLIISSVVFIEIVENLLKEEIYVFDELVYKYVSKFINPFFTEFFKFYTNIGGVIVVVAISIFACFFIKKNKYAKFIPINTVSIFSLNYILKNMFNRQRPTEYMIVKESGYSFPSGHSMVSMAFYGFFIYLIFKNVKDKKIKYTVISLLSIIIFLIGLSRIYLGVHYASDVLAGFVISTAYLALYTKIVDRITNDDK